MCSAKSSRSVFLKITYLIHRCLQHLETYKRGLFVGEKARSHLRVGMDVVSEVTDNMTEFPHILFQNPDFSGDIKELSAVVL